MMGRGEVLMLRTMDDRKDVEAVLREIRALGWEPKVSQTFDKFANCYWSSALRSGHEMPGIYPSPNHIPGQGRTRILAANDILRRINNQLKGER